MPERAAPLTREGAEAARRAFRTRSLWVGAMITDLQEYLDETGHYMLVSFYRGGTKLYKLEETRKSDAS